MNKEFDYKKIDLYKEAVDDGFQYMYMEDAGNYPEDFYTITIGKNFKNNHYQLLDMEGGGNINHLISESNWEKFKEEAKKYFDNNF
ncbi:hypothetical protein [Fusobacterium ulcerans]|uniref:hypothetical protein n=1 Tax=Fusobacterium ulcerans TaxID=861 RepID=UPI0026DB3776|nr:hypothetical protein [Fusobacterium ulcerans]